MRVTRPALHAPAHRPITHFTHIGNHLVVCRPKQQPYVVHKTLSRRCLLVASPPSSQATWQAGEMHPTAQPHKPPENVALVIRQSLSKVVFAAVTFILRLWRWTDSLWLQMARLPKLVARPTPAPAAAVAVPVPTPARPPPLRAPTSHHPACGIADPAVLHMLQKLHDPTTTHDDRVAHVQQAVGMDSTRTLFSATSRHSLQVEKMRAERGVPEPSGAQLWSVEGTKDVLEEEGALRDALFEKIYEQLASDECRREQGL